MISDVTATSVTALSRLITRTDTFASALTCKNVVRSQRLAVAECRIIRECLILTDGRTLDR